MGQSTNGQICFGILLEDGIELPWDKDEFEGEPWEWWRKINGYKPLYECFTQDGQEYAEGFSRDDPRIDEMMDHQSAWDKSNPLPFEMVNVCSGDYPIWIIAVPKTVVTANRGTPLALTSEWLEEDLLVGHNLEEFCEKHDIKHADAPKWYLSSYWG